MPHARTFSPSEAAPAHAGNILPTCAKERPAMPGTRPRTEPRHNNGCRERPEHINRPEIELVRYWAAALRRAHWARLPRPTASVNFVVL